MKLLDYLNGVVDDLKANAPFLNDVATHGKLFGPDELRAISLASPACRISMLGSRGGSVSLYRGTAAMGRANNGQFRGPLQMVAFLIEQDAKVEARLRVINLADEFMTFIEHRHFGMGDIVGPALVTGFEILYSVEVEDSGVALAAVSWEQDVFFGRDLHEEDLKILFQGTDFPETDFNTFDQLPHPLAEGTAFGEADPAADEPTDVSGS